MQCRLVSFRFHITHGTGIAFEIIESLVSKANRAFGYPVEESLIVRCNEQCGVAIECGKRLFEPEKSW